MSRSWWGKFFLLIAFVVLSGVYVFPTLANLDLEKTKFPFKQKINLGLDLQGGLYMVLGVDFNKVYKDIVERQAFGIETDFKEKGIPIKAAKFLRDSKNDDPRIALEFDPANRTAVYNEFKRVYAR